MWGPTGSGKSRLLADIEWLAQGDTPTGRKVLINQETPDPELRFSIEHRIVAQLSQNMNFVMDTRVGEFLKLHAESRMIDSPCIVSDIIAMANELAGESFTAETAVTALSGGQSRALMIADTACLSTSPIVLIDEIENAGVDKSKALDLLCSQEKIVLIATHDPLLALMCSQRLVICNGAVQKVIAADAGERRQLEQLLRIDELVQELRRRIRAGERIEENALEQMLRSEAGMT
ncbi:ATP-binding cassette domain-containing protein [Alkalispirochaeta alkalica]|uniref:ATP-binding cassette domain-containing protein n=1 Tax=Alkalispirochaeta alkalica TaxID=46356 RepID=UPI00037F609B|nr:ATP-binding cassette domain-containing protein [Alkalispirochaeta alkalica]